MHSMLFGVASCGASRSHAQLNGVNASELLPVELLEAVHGCIAQWSQYFGRSSPHRASGSKDEVLGKPKPNVHPVKYSTTLLQCNARASQPYSSHVQLGKVDAWAPLVSSSYTPSQSRLVEDLLFAFSSKRHTHAHTHALRVTER
jgi:hypothetical protein